MKVKALIQLNVSTKQNSTKKKTTKELIQTKVEDKTWSWQYITVYTVKTTGQLRCYISEPNQLQHISQDFQPKRYEGFQREFLYSIIEKRNRI